MNNIFLYIWKKELRSELYTWKSMLWLVIASIFFSFTSYLLLTNKELSLLDQTELMLLLGQIVIGVALLIVSIDACSIISSEFEKETAETLFLAPISMTDFIVGKFLAILTLWLSIFVVSLPYIIVASIGSHLTLAFIGYVFLLGTLGIIGLTALIFAVSLIYRSTKNTLTTALILLIIMVVPALFSSTLKGNTLAQLFSRVNPVDNIFLSLDNVLVDYKVSLIQNWNFLLPIIIFCLLMIVVLFFAVRSFKNKGIIKND
jgi:ABC-2 type transport system permease protein